MNKQFICTNIFQKWPSGTHKSTHIRCTTKNLATFVANATLCISQQSYRTKFIGMECLCNMQQITNEWQAKDYTLYTCGKKFGQKQSDKEKATYNGQNFLTKLKKNSSNKLNKKNTSSSQDNRKINNNGSNTVIIIPIPTIIRKFASNSIYASCLGGMLTPLPAQVPYSHQKIFGLFSKLIKVNRISPSAI